MKVTRNLFIKKIQLIQSYCYIYIFKIKITIKMLIKLNKTYKTKVKNNLNVRIKAGQFWGMTHPGKANVVADALSRKTLHMSMLMVKELDLIEQFRDLSLVCEGTPTSVKLGMLKLTSGILEEIREGQKADVGLIDKLTLINQGKSGEFRVDENGILKFGDRVCVPDVDELPKRILEEGHRSGLSIHPGATRMYHDLKKLFWWPGMKREIAEFVYSCLTCQKSKIEH